MEILWNQETQHQKQDLEYFGDINYMKYILLGAAIAFAMYLGDKYIL